MSEQAKAKKEWTALTAVLAWEAQVAAAPNTLEAYAKGHSVMLHHRAEIIAALSAPAQGEAVAWQWREDSTHDGTFSSGWMDCSREEYQARLTILAGRDTASMAGAHPAIREDAMGWPVQVRALGVITTPTEDKGGAWPDDAAVRHRDVLIVMRAGKPLLTPREQNALDFAIAALTTAAQPAPSSGEGAKS